MYSTSAHEESSGTCQKERDQNNSVVTRLETGVVGTWPAVLSGGRAIHQEKDYEAATTWPLHITCLGDLPNGLITCQDLACK